MKKRTNEFFIASLTRRREHRAIPIPALKSRAKVMATLRVATQLP
jgi:hypothetical protein